MATLEKKVTPAMNELLLADLTNEEISVAMHQLPPIKAPGPDGFSAYFFQHNWGTVQVEVCNVVLHFFHTGVLDEHINETLIALIPKTLSPESAFEFRPISLCNVLYKLISKVLANRLKIVLPNIISFTQIECFSPGAIDNR